MDFDTFTALAIRLKAAPLPGVASHRKMAPSTRLEALNNAAIARRNPKKAAVIALFYPDAGHNTRFLLTMRKEYKGVHSNQVSFPGGKLETSDKDVKSAALRETYEEVGIAPDAIEIFKDLSEIYIPPSNFRVWPFMGMLREQPLFTPQASEVAELIEVRLADLLDEQTVDYERLNTSYAKHITTPVFKFNGYTVWGATAMMLSEVKELFKMCYTH